ncbi:Glycerol-3-phosphate_dehydrogenase [Hexamita inflata]|uniref:Glycerol-3-phosphate dehydrogenase n=1 Tax=Hexamita inflata TaxID=28002 RepID=A0AA86S2H2_9EUKA|nr:Glycerol-3-phosphate dehydrogenase [Hexamita inflata]CAI9976855.1 Glycerol-3-phosphate dehydrogenase [Hexamita inflata]
MDCDYDVVIIGAGCVGAFAAFYASKYDLRVCVLESRAHPGLVTTNANCGIVHAGHNTKHNTLKSQLIDRGNALIAELAPLLNFSFKRCGELVVAASPDEYQQLDEMYAYSKSINVPVEYWDAEQLRAHEPNLSHSIQRAILTPTAGIVNPHELTISAVQTAVKNGAHLFCDQKVIEITRNGSVFTVKTEKKTFRTKTVVNCAGLYADQIAKMDDLNTKINIRPRKGECYILNEVLVNRLIFPIPFGTSKGMLVIPTVDGKTLVGPTADLVDSKEDVCTSEDGKKRIFALAEKMVPKVNMSMIESEFAGCRAVDASEDFVMNQKDGFINFAGTQSPGLTSSPAIGQVLVEEILKNFANAKLKEKWEYAPLVKTQKADCTQKLDIVEEITNKGDQTHKTTYSWVRGYEQ